MSPPPRKAHVARVSAFTLAEVLITLSIIGVVSAVTLPTLIKNHQRTVYVTQLRKVYNEFSQALEQVVTDKNAVSFAEARAGNSFYKDYFKTIKNCAPNSLNDCFASSYENIDGDDISARDLINTSASCSVLSSGASLCVRMESSKYLNLLLDINGKEGPNIYGRDLFIVLFNKRTASLLSTGGSSSGCTGGGDLDDYGDCFGKILKDGWVMDY